MYYPHQQYSLYLPLNATNQVAVAQTTKEFDGAGALLPPQDEFTVFRDPVTFSTHVTGHQPPTSNNSNASSPIVGTSNNNGSGAPSTLTREGSSLGGGIFPRAKPFASAVRPAPVKTISTSGSTSGASSSASNNNSNNDANVALMVLTPHEREVGRLSRSGRQLSELEILQEKHEAEFRRVVPVIAQSLKDVVAQHESLIRNGAPRDEKYATYDTNAVPSIKIDDYVQRIAEYTYISPTTLVASLIVLDRLSQRHPSLLFTMLNIYKLFFVAVRIASKVVDLRTLNNKNFASVGGISNRHLNEVESRMLMDLRFDLYISPSEVLYYVQKGFAITTFIPRNVSLSGTVSLGSSGGGVVVVTAQNGMMAAVSSHPGSPSALIVGNGNGNGSSNPSAPRSSSSQRLGAGSRRGSGSTGAGGSGAAPTPIPNNGNSTVNGINNNNNNGHTHLSYTSANNTTSNNNNNNNNGMMNGTFNGTGSSIYGLGGTTNSNSSMNNSGTTATSTATTIARPPDTESPSNRPNIRRRPSSQHQQ